jgi:hypothetical protein
MNADFAALALDEAYELGELVTLERISAAPLTGVRLLKDNRDDTLNVGDAKVSGRTFKFRLLVSEIGAVRPKGWIIVLTDGVKFVIQEATRPDSQRLEWRGIANPIKP